MVEVKAAGSDDPDAAPESAAADGEIWRSREDLLLASAVVRHGAASWDAVAGEVQSRSPGPSVFTPDSCRLRYRLLHRRFADGDGDEEPDAAERLQKKLRELRVDELKREDKQGDITIEFLQSKVKRLKEERQKSLSGEIKPAEVKEEGPPDEESNSPDLKRDGGGGDEAAKQDPVSGENGEGLQKEEAASASVPITAAEADPLVAFLDAVRTSKSGSVFEHRLESQESAGYRDTIRRHVDLDTIRSRLDPGSTEARYTSASEFHRDLLLLCANALAFFPRGSPEHAAALKTRAFVSKRIPKSDTAGKATEKPGKAADAGSLLENKTSLTFSRKRSSIVAKAAPAVVVKEEKVDEADEMEEDKNKKRGGAAARGPRTNKTRGPAANAAAADSKGGGVIKKQKAVDFLKRINDSSASTERVKVLETLKLSAAMESGSKNEPGSSGSTSKKKAAAETAAGRKATGRPPKRAAAPPTPPPSKRGKDDRLSRKRGKR